MTDRGRRSANQPAGFALVARRISGWTSNLIATGVILVLALGLGRELVRWWRVAPEDIAAAGAASQRLPSATLDPTQASTLQFGDSASTLQRRVVAGDRDQARRALADDCRLAAAETPLPGGPIAAAETRLLEAVQALEPLESTAGVRLYGPDVGFPMIVAVADSAPAAGPSPRARSTASEPPASDVNSSAGGNSEQLGASRGRVLVWGIAAPAGPRAWSLYTCRPSNSSASAAAAIPGLALPPSSHRTMSMASGGGETLLAFAGTGTVDGWRQFFADSLPAANWTAIDPWAWTAGAWRARYERSAAAGGAALELQFGAGPRGDLSGLARIVPAAPASTIEREQR